MLRELIASCTIPLLGAAAVDYDMQQLLGAAAVDYDMQQHLQ